jgi:hypothetical protein
MGLWHSRQRSIRQRLQGDGTTDLDGRCDLEVPENRAGALQVGVEQRVSVEAGGCAAAPFSV